MINIIPKPTLQLQLYKSIHYKNSQSPACSTYIMLFNISDKLEHTSVAKLQRRER